MAKHGRTNVPDEPVARALYDLRTDPGETKNLLALPSATERGSLAATLDRALRAHLARQSGRAAPVQLEEQTIQELRALGYIRQ